MFEGKSSPRVGFPLYYFISFGSHLPEHRAAPEPGPWSEPEEAAKAFKKQINLKSLQRKGSLKARIKLKLSSRLLSLHLIAFILSFLYTFP